MCRPIRGPVPAANRLPGEQSCLAIAKVDVAGVRVAVHYRIRLLDNHFRDRTIVVDDEAACPTYRNSHGLGLEICYVPSVAAQRDCRERLIDAALSLCIRCGYEDKTI